MSPKEIEKLAAEMGWQVKTDPDGQMVICTGVKQPSLESRDHVDESETEAYEKWVENQARRHAEAALSEQEAVDWQKGVVHRNQYGGFGSVEPFDAST